MVLCKQYFAYLGQKLTLEYFHVYLLVVLWQNQLFSNKWEFFPESSIIIGSVESKNKIFDNLGYNILELYNVLV